MAGSDRPDNADENPAVAALFLRLQTSDASPENSLESIRYSFFLNKTISPEGS